MNNSGDAAEQVLRMSLQGVEIAAKITGSAAKEIAIMMIAALKSKDSKLKPKGKARLTAMLKSGQPLEVFSVREKDLKQFIQGAKQYGIVYCALKNTKNCPDGMVDIMVKAEDAPKINRIVERFDLGTVDKAKVDSKVAVERESISADEVRAPTPKETTEKLLDDLLGGSTEKSSDKTIEAVPTAKKAEKSVNELHSPLAEGPITETPLSGPTSKTEKKSEDPISTKQPGKSSVSRELREIKVSQKTREETQSERPLNQRTEGKSKINNTTTTHTQPKKNNKKSIKKVRTR